MAEKLDLFGLAKNVDIGSYIEAHYDLGWDRDKKAECPFCGSSKTKAFSLQPKKQIVRCFSCMPKAMNIIDFVMEMEGLTNHYAAKKICIDMGLIQEDNKPVDAEAKKAIDAKRETLLKEKEAKRAKEEAELKAEQERSGVRMSKIAPKLLEAFTLNPEIKANSKRYLRWSDKLEAWYFDYLGWDEEHQSVCIVNYDRESGVVHNIKHREKYVWDPVTKSIDTGRRMPGKWISMPNASGAPFPIEYFRKHHDERVVLSFGEKDSLNLLSYDINTLTLGGVSASLEPHLELFKDKTVFIWPDHQLVEYIAAMARYKELENVAKHVYIVSFLHIEKTLADKYDISDFIFEQKFADADALWKRIEYSCFRLTNSYIEDVSSYYEGGNEKLLKRLDAFRSSAKSMKFQDIEAEILKVAKPVKSEMDAEIDASEQMLMEANGHELLKDFRHFLSEKHSEDEAFVETFKLAMQYKKRLFDQFRKHHEVDATIAFVNDAKTSGHEIATYRERMYVWTGSHYQHIDDKELKVFIIQRWMNAAKVNMKQQTPDFTKKVVEGVFYRGIPLERFKENQHHRIINFDNGTAYLHNSGKLVFRNSHLKADAMTSMLPISYDPSAKAPKWKRFLKEVLPDLTEQNALMEFMGYCFLNTHSYQKFLFLLGSGANGKSIVLNVIKKFFGGEMTSNVDLQQLFSHEMVGIEGKYINIGSEINPKGLDKGQIENLKKLTAGESTQLNPKNAAPYDISGGEIPKFIFSGNNKPQGNLDGGLFRRMLLLNFNRTISKEERIQALEDRFDDEMSGIFNLAMEGLERLLAQGDFSISENMRRNLEEYQEEANPILAYARENLKADPRTMVARKFLYAHYKAWTEERGHHAAAERTFYSKLKDIIKDLQDVQPRYLGIHHNVLGNRARL